MNTTEKIIRDHQNKSKQVRRLKRSLKLKSIHSVNKEQLIKRLEDKLDYLKDYKRNPVGDSWCSNSDYQRESGKRDGQIDILEDVIRLIKNDLKHWL